MHHSDTIGIERSQIHIVQNNQSGATLIGCTAGEV
jgi:hypothetical protein